MVKLVTLVGHRYCVNDLTKCGRAALDVDHCERVWFREVRAKQQRVGKIFWGSFHRKFRGSVKSRIRPHCHWNSSLFVPTAVLATPKKKGPPGHSATVVAVSAGDGPGP